MKYNTISFSLVLTLMFLVNITSSGAINNVFNGITQGVHEFGKVANKIINGRAVDAGNGQKVLHNNLKTVNSKNAGVKDQQVHVNKVVGTVKTVKAENTQKITLTNSPQTAAPQKKVVAAAPNSGDKVVKTHIGNGATVLNKNIVVSPDLIAHDNANTREFLINFDFGPMHNQLKRLIKDEKDRKKLTDSIEDLVFSANTWLKRYIRIDKSEEPLVEPVDDDFICNYKAKGKKFNAHLVVVVEIFNKEDHGDESANDDPRAKTLAIGGNCAYNDKGRADIGYLWFANIEPLKNLNDSLKMKRVVTVIHEILHIVAFYSRDIKEIQEKKILAKHKSLQNILKSKNTIYSEGHWNRAYLKEDLMISTDNIYTSFTDYSLDMVESQAPGLVGNRQILTTNFVLKGIQNHMDLFNYTCKKGEEPKFDAFCSSQEVSFGFKSTKCSKDFRFVETCAANPDKQSGCHLRIAVASGDCLNVDAANPKINPYARYGPDSRCFTLLQGQNPSIGMCLEFKITTDSGGVKRVVIVFNNLTYSCTKDNEVLEIKIQDTNRKLDIQCPVINDFIGAVEYTHCPNNCHYKGICINQKCLCMGSYDENDHCKSKKTINNIAYQMSNILTGGRFPDPEDEEEDD